MVRQFLERNRLDGLIREGLGLARPLLCRVSRLFGLHDQRLIRRFLATPSPHRLQVGCGSHPLPGWLNTDWLPASRSIVQMDATCPFPLPDQCVDYVFSEHMIEHVDYPGGCRMLAECHRVLRDGGVLRISTPDLAFLIELYRDPSSDFRRRYLEWDRRSFWPYAPQPAASFAINNFVRAWGHRFIYDEETLRQALQNAGFGGIVRCELGESSHEALRNLENESRLPNGFLRFQTMTLEATRLAGK